MGPEAVFRNAEADGTAAMKNLQDPVPRSGLAGGPPRKVISAPAYDITGQSSGRSSSSDLPTGSGLAPTDRFVPDGPIHPAKPVAPTNQPQVDAGPEQRHISAAIHTFLRHQIRSKNGKQPAPRRWRRPRTRARRPARSPAPAARLRLRQPPPSRAGAAAGPTPGSQQ